jgi:arsenate reductase
VDREAKRFAALGLKQAHYGEARWLELLEEEPLLLRTPLVRRGNEVTIGADEDAWRRWAAG